MSPPMTTMQSKGVGSVPDERCPNCGAAVHVPYGPDIRFNPPCTKPMVYRAECSADCLSPSWSAFTRERALELWNNGIRRAALSKAGVTQ